MSDQASQTENIAQVLEPTFLAAPGRLEVVNRPGCTYRPSTLTLEEKFERAMLVGEECIQPEELKTLLEKKPVPICYDGFEPSGRMHIAQGIMKAINVNRLTSAGCVFVFWVADWFGMLNGKMGGDLKKIRKVGEYFIHVWKAAGMDLENVRFIWTSEEIDRDANGYWMRVMDITKRSSISRVKRCGQIMGRSEGDDQPASQIMYPCMQAADIFYIGADICQLGMDQRKVNMLARDYVESYNKDNKKNKLRKPVILSHAMLPGLLEGQAKMSKSDPNSAIFMEDSVEDVNRKIKKAFCPPQIIEENPVVSYIEMLVFPKFEEFSLTYKVESTVEETNEAGETVTKTVYNAVDKTYKSFEDFKVDYVSGLLHPSDVKPALASALNKMIEPVRQHFKNDPEARALIEEIKKYKVTK